MTSIFEGQNVMEGIRQVNGYQQIVGIVTSTALTVPTLTRFCIIQCTSQNVRWTDDGVTTPTATVGMRLQVGETFLYNGSFSNIRFIQEAATATLNISYYK